MTVDLFDNDTSEGRWVVRGPAGTSLSGVTFHITRTSSIALSYHLLDFVALTDDEQLLLGFGERGIIIRGRNLQQLPEDLILRKIVRVLVTPRSDGIGAPPDEEVVAGIELSDQPMEAMFSHPFPRRPRTR